MLSLHLLQSLCRVPLFLLPIKSNFSGRGTSLGIRQFLGSVGSHSVQGENMMLLLQPLENGSCLTLSRRLAKRLYYVLEALSLPILLSLYLVVSRLTTNSISPRALAIVISPKK